jgi:hypothetical protein
VHMRRSTDRPAAACSHGVPGGDDGSGLSRGAYVRGRGISQGRGWCYRSARHLPGDDWWIVVRLCARPETARRGLTTRAGPLSFQRHSACAAAANSLSSSLGGNRWP